MPRRHPTWFILALALAPAVACGGVVDQRVPGESAGSDAAIDGSFSCILTPVAGDPCTSSASLCSWPPPPGCVGPLWECSAGTWEYVAEPVCIGSSSAGGGAGDAAP